MHRHDEVHTAPGTPPEAQPPALRRQDAATPRLGLSLLIALVAGCAAIAAIVLWLVGDLPGSR